MEKKKRLQQKKLIKRTLYVDGMHCASCEVIIENKLLKQDGIESADALLKENKVVFNYIGESKLDVNQLNKDFEKLGYRFSEKKFRKNNTPIVSIQKGLLIVNSEKFKNLIIAFLIVISLIIAFHIVENLQLGQYISVDSNSALPTFFLLGVIAGLSSCAALVGSLLLSMTKQWNELYISKDSQIKKTQPHFMFHAGRMISFTILGGLLGLLGETITLSNNYYFAIFTILVSIVMFLLAMQMLGVQWAQKFQLAIPKSLTRHVADESNFNGKYMPFGIGAITFILPCGFTLIAQTIALASGSFIQGALIMFIFALGTLPSLLAISISGIAFNSKPHFTEKFNIIAGLVIVFFALYNINGQLNVMGFPSLNDISLSNNQESVQVTENIDQGKQIINITAKGFEYIPTSSMTIKAGVPTSLIVDNQGIQGCGAFMAANGLINNYFALKKGINEIDLGIPKKGTYKLTCSMGMVAPVIIKVI